MISSTGASTIPKNVSKEAIQSSVIGPLIFSKNDYENPPPTKLANDTSVPCMLCDNVYNFRIGDSRDQYLAHLYMIHRLVIADVHEIDCLVSYCHFWKEKFQEHPLEKFCSAMLMNQLPDGTPAIDEKYFLLSNIEPTDYELRLRLKQDMMELVLTRHQFERTDRNFNRGCLYCRDVQAETRSEFLEHLYKKHFLLLGKAENLVFVDELVDIVQEKMNKLICIYCEKTFKDRPTLKEHMRKKGHKRINPDLKSYDRFFLVNYKNDRLKGTTIKQPHKANLGKEENSPFHSEDSDSNWSDWYGEEQPTTCLFCSNSEPKIESLKDHMKLHHDFDFDTNVVGFSFYQRVKVVNYIRRQMHVLKCVLCREVFHTREHLEIHLKEAGHFSIGEQQYWDQPEFFFPTYEDDQFLCHLEDDSPDQSDDSSMVVSENVNANVSTEAESLSLEGFRLE
ncbi:zinc finger protein 277 [Malaya genurostris]|uniref:zinc finger protein 277 n=1 Tax=Malaya genurostris TaxID=325434 RepID=UPI0026F3DA8E|nr:zinc finger protein 277 [Malaya genurostris]